MLDLCWIQTLKTWFLHFFKFLAVETCSFFLLDDLTPSGRYYDASRTQDVFDSLGKHHICVSSNALIVFWRLDVPEDLRVEHGYHGSY